MENLAQSASFHSRETTAPSNPGIKQLGSVVLGLSLLTRRMRDEPDEAAPHVTAGEPPAAGKLPLHKLVPWFIVDFLVLAALRSADLVPHAAPAPLSITSNMLTIVSMAALGLGTDLKVVAQAGARVIAVVTLSLVVLGGISLSLIRMLGIT